MSKFIEVETVSSSWVSQHWVYRYADKVLLNLDVIAEIYPLEEYSVNDKDGNLHKDKCATIYRTSVHGQGINGVSTHMMITEESYKKLVKVLEII